MTARIVRADETHIAGIRAVEEACFSRPWSEASIRTELENGRSALFAALDGEAVVGWAGLEALFGEGSVTNIAVLPACRRQGVGRALTAALIAEARRLALDRLLLEVRASNAPAIALYASLGFETIGRRPRFYDFPREDALLMRLAPIYEEET